MSSDEAARLASGPGPGERAGGMGVTWMRFTSDGDAASVIDRARDVLLRLVDLPLEAFDDMATGDLLPDWFMASFGPEPEDGKWPNNLDYWSFFGWLYWLNPEVRIWRWWDAEVSDPSHGTVTIQINDWPTPVAALEWLLIACGATSAQYFES